MSKSDKQLKEACTFLMCNDTYTGVRLLLWKVIAVLTNKMAKMKGYSDWVEAYHKL